MDNNKENPVLGEIEKRILEGASAVSSEQSGLEKIISGAIASTKKSGQATEARIQSDFASERNFMLGQAERTTTTSLEGRQGFGTQMAALRALTETTDKTIRDLDQRKQDALMANDAATASRINELQVKEFEFRQKARQDMFNNLIQAGSFALGKSEFEARRTEEQERMQLSKRAQRFTEKMGKAELGQKERQMSLAERAQDFGESQAMANVALQYGVSLQEGDTLDTVVARATPFASEKQKLELDRIRADINSAKATTARAMQQMKMDEQTFSEAERLAIAAQVRKGNVDISKMPIREQAKIYGYVVGIGDEALTKMTQLARSQNFADIDALKQEATRQGIDFKKEEAEAAFFSVGLDVPEQPGLLERLKRNRSSNAPKNFPMINGVLVPSGTEVVS